MKKVLIAFLLGFACCAGIFGALSYHFILTKERLVVERKGELGLENTFVDTRSWGVGDYFKNPKVAAILARSGIKRAFESGGKQTDEAIEAAKKAVDDGLEKVQESMRK